MRIGPRAHLAYCTNVHSGEDWEQTRASLAGPIRRVHAQIAAGRPWALGLRLSGAAAATLAAEPAERAWLRHWLAEHQAYIFSINAFPRGPFHGTRVKEQAYLPDWSDPARLSYTLQVAELLAELTSRDSEPTLSTVPLGYAAVARSSDDRARMQEHLILAREGLAQLADRTGRRIRLALEPEPMCLLGTAREATDFLTHHFACDTEARHWLGVNLDACHHAVEFEGPAHALKTFRAAAIPVLKIHLSAALALPPTVAALQRLASMDEPTYLHQTFLQTQAGTLARYADIPEGVTAALQQLNQLREIRTHFHVPLHAGSLGDGLRSTVAELRALLDVLVADPASCDQLEIETYTWAVLPAALRAVSVEEQVVREYEWVLAEFKERGWNRA